MNKENLSKFKQIFEEQRRELLSRPSKIAEEFHIDPNEIKDEIDLTSTELETSMRMRLNNRRALLLRKIEEALDRITSGTFGVCESCDDEIELRRLEARPTATMCFHCKEEQERTEHNHIDGRKHKSLGIRMRLLA